MPPTSRRHFLALGGTAAAGAAALWTRRSSGRDATVAAQAAPDLVWGDSPAQTRTPTPAPVPTIPPPPLKVRGREALSLLPGTPWETPAVEFSSGARGTRVMVLGGVHGNEPGGWLAAEAIAGWEIARGSLLVVPRANRASTRALERTIAGYGDLNRLYPGNPEGQPMARMAAAIIELAREFRPDYILDLHESWVFYNERGAAGGTAFIGQTVAVGVRGEPVERMQGIVDAVNGEITAREQLTLRTTNSQGRPPSSSATPGTNDANGGASSLSLANWVPGAVPVLIEMGQQNQTDARRSYLHQLFVQTALQQHTML